MGVLALTVIYFQNPSLRNYVYHYEFSVVSAVKSLFTTTPWVRLIGLPGPTANFVTRYINEGNDLYTYMHLIDQYRLYDYN